MDKDYQKKNQGVIHKVNVADLGEIKKLENQTALNKRQEHYLKLKMLQ